MVRHWLIVAAFPLVLGLPAESAAEASGNAVEPAAERPLLLAQARGRQAQRRAAPRRGRATQRAQTQQKAAEPETAEGQELRRGEKVEFDARLIQGQTAKAGAVFLFERVSSDLSSMVQERRSYRREIIEEVFPQEKDR